MPKKPSFFERLTGSVTIPDDDMDDTVPGTKESPADWMEEENEEGQLTVDVYRTPTEIIIKTMVAGLRPADLDISITREMVTIRGKRQEESGILDGDYFFKELYWGSFSRTILLPEEVDPEHAEASEKDGLLIIHLPQIDKERTQQLKVKSG